MREENKVFWQAVLITVLLSMLAISVIYAEVRLFNLMVETSTWWVGLFCGGAILILAPMVVVSCVGAIYTFSALLTESLKKLYRWL